MEEEREQDVAKAAKATKKQTQTEQTAQALRNAANVVGLSPEVAGRVANGIKIADKVTGGGLTRGAARIVNAVPLGKTVGKVAGGKLATGATSLASAKAGNPSKDGFSKTKGPDSGTKTKKSGSSSLGSFMSLDNQTSSESSSLFGSESLSVLTGNISIIKIILIVFAFFLLLFTLFLSAIFSAEDDYEEKYKAMAVSEMSSQIISTPGTATAAPGLQVASATENLLDLILNKIDFKIFNKEKPTADADGSYSVRDSSTFGDYLKSLKGKFKDKFIKEFYNLGNIFGTGTDVCTDSSCSGNAEVEFYQKITDISYRYKKLYGIELDWPLITSTILVGDGNKVETFKANLNPYTVKELNNLKETMSLDWDYDYKNIDDYEYLAGLDSRYDLQILAKNMVSKHTVQTCSVNDEVKKELELDDIEDVKIEEEKELYESTAADKRKDLTLEYYLPCANGQKYEINSTYKLDKEKYDDFLNEYLENKYVVKKNIKAKTQDGGSSSDYSIGDGTYGWPLPEGATKCMSSGFGPRKPPTPGASSFHNGNDYGAASGTPVFAIADGTVIAAGFQSCAGNYVKIDHGNGVISIYMHSSQLEVSTGQHVSKGQEIMKVGSTGCSTGAHLHIGIMIGNNYVDPVGYIGGLPRC